MSLSIETKRGMNRAGKLQSLLHCVETADSVLHRMKCE